MADSFDRLKSALADRYAIERELGQGGMATVYLARDVKHDRKVAIKVLRRELAAVLGAKRFVQEIRTTASLHHPHILPLHDSGEADGFLYYVMPYIEGETLRDTLDRERQLDVDAAVTLTVQIADALDYAHRQNVIHRDIKPENILLHDGRPIVADFGIALAVSAAAGRRLTETGLSIGTPHYMSPEQATAEKDLTSRSDIYSLGAVLYEMLTGAPPHTGSTAQQVIMKIVTEEASPVTTTRRSVPPNVSAAVAKSLEKLPADRFTSAHDFAAALRDPGFRSGGVVYAAAVSAGEMRKWKRLALTGGVGSLLLLMVGFLGWLRPIRGGPSAPPSHLAILAPGIGGSGASAQARHVTLTPDGSTVFYTTVDDVGNNRIMQYPLDALEPTALPPELDYLIGNPAVSPDGQWLVLSALDGRIYRFPLNGGSGGVHQMDISGSPFFAWAPNGDLWVTPSLFGNVIRRVGRDSMTVRVEGVETVRLQQILPDGRRALAVVGGLASGSGPAAVVDLETGTATPLLNTTVTQVGYTQGFLVYVVEDGTLFAAPFDARRTEVTGSSVPLATGVSGPGIAGMSDFAVASNGTVAYVPDEPRGLVLVARDGTVRSVAQERKAYHSPRFSPNGRFVAVDFIFPDGRDVWVVDLANGTMSRATFDGDGHDAAWTPDGRLLTYTSSKTGVLGIYRTSPGSLDRAEPLLATPRLTYTGIWHPDASKMITVANELRDGSQSDLAVIANGGRGPLEPLLASQFNEEYPAVSPDGRWLAFVSDQSGLQEVYVRSLERSGETVVVSQTGGTEPVWGPGGRELFYRGTIEGQTAIIAATLDTSAGLVVTRRQPLFPASEYVGSAVHANFDVSPDGERFVLIQRSPGTRIMVIQNLPALVERRRGARTNDQ